MMRRMFLATACLVALSLAAVAADKDEAGWKPLFNGKNLDGWVQKNGTARYQVENGAIVGKTNEGSPNSFLCTTKDYSNFELEFEVKVDDQLNSGVQIRSKTRGGPTGRVHGPQVEIATNGTAGYIYGEALTTGWLSRDPSNPKATGPRPLTVFKKGEWNKFRVIAQGKSIKTWINGKPVADLTDNKTDMMSGFIGLQVHGIKKGFGPYEVRWRNIRIKELK
jgi:3-keto-disaccharide hydrolase